MQTSGVNRHFEQLRNDNPNISHSLRDLTPRTVLCSWAKFCFALKKLSLYLSLSLCLPWPFSVFSLLSFSFCQPPLLPLSLFPSLCSTESNSDRPSPTGLCRRPTLRRWSVSPISSTLSLPPSVPFPLSSPFLFVTSVDTLTGRDSQTSQFPHGLGYFALGLQGIFSWLDYTPTQKKS